MNAMPAGAPPGDAETPPLKPPLRLVKGLALTKLRSAPTSPRTAPAPSRTAPDMLSRAAPTPSRTAPAVPYSPAPGIPPRPVREALPRPARNVPPRRVLDVPPRPARDLPPCPAQEAPLRLTTRGRVVVAALAALVAMAVSLFAARTAQATHYSAPSRQNLVHVVVGPGQSLWSVAESADPDQDTRLVVKQIIDLNSLSSDTVFAGQQLLVPRG